MFDILKKAITSMIDIRIPKGHGISCDDGIVISKDQANKSMEPLSDYSCKYTLAENRGSFEIDGMIRLRNGENAYKVRHVATGTQIVATKDIFTLLFSKIE